MVRRGSGSQSTRECRTSLSLLSNLLARRHTRFLSILLVSVSGSLWGRNVERAARSLFQLKLAIWNLSSMAQSVGSTCGSCDRSFSGPSTLSVSWLFLPWLRDSWVRDGFLVPNRRY